MIELPFARNVCPFKRDTLVLGCAWTSVCAFHDVCCVVPRHGLTVAVVVVVVVAVVVVVVVAVAVVVAVVVAVAVAVAVALPEVSLLRATA